MRILQLVIIGFTLVFAAVLSGCGGCSTSERPRVDANAEGAPPRPPIAADEPRAWDDLLHTTDARLAVSSKVDNPHDFPEHIADGRLETAWNGKTNDLVGGWLGVA